MTEHWKPVVGFEETHEVSDQGRLRRALYALPTRGTRPGRIFIGMGYSHGYSQVILRQDGKNKTRSLHRLVLTAFIGPCPPDMECNHKNAVRADNRLENLEWVTHSDNEKHAHQILGRCTPRGETHYNAKLTEVEVKVIKQARFLKIPAKWLANWFNVGNRVITELWSGRTWRHISAN